MQNRIELAEEKPEMSTLYCVYITFLVTSLLKTLNYRTNEKRPFKGKLAP